MKKLLKAIITILLVQAFTNCEVDEIKKETNEEKEFYVKRIKISDDRVLQGLLSDLTISGSKNGRTTETTFGEIHTDEAVKVNNPEDNTVRYSLLFKQIPGSSNFENFIIRKKGDENNYYKMLFEPSREWLSSNSKNPDWTKYSGNITLRNLDNKHSIVATLENGVSTRSNSSGGRTQTCCEFITEITETGGWYVAIDCGTDFYWSAFLRSKDCGDSSTGGGSTGGGTGGSTGGGYGGGSWGGDGSGGGGTGTGSGTGGSDNVGVIMPQTKVCPGDDAFVPLSYVCPGDAEAAARQERINALLEYIYQNPFALIELPCNQLPNWQSLALHKVPQPVDDKLNALKQDQTVWARLIPFNTWDVQYLDEGQGAVVNMDFYSVTVSQLPSGLSAPAFLEKIRKEINTFVDQTSADFEPFNESEDALWQSNNYLGSIIHIDMGNDHTWLGGWNFVQQPDDGSVICTMAQSNEWIFTTITAPGDGEHPVSGHRKFGFTQNTDGTYTFFTRGIDRTTGYVDQVLQWNTNKVFEDTEQLWTSLQNKVRDYVNSHGGSASVNASNTVIARPRWYHVEEYLNGTKTLQELGCN